MTRRPEFHEDFGWDEIPRSSDRSFGFVIAGALGILGGIGLWRGHGAAWWSLGAALALVVLALVRPGVLGPLNRLWFAIGLLLYRIVNPVVLGVLFFLCVVPTGLLMRLMGKNPLRLGFDPGAPTYWIERRPPGPAPESMRNQF